MDEPAGSLLDRLNTHKSLLHRSSFSWGQESSNTMCHCTCEMASEYECDRRQTGS